MSEYEDLQKGIENLDLGKVESVSFPLWENSTHITIETDEFTSICPRTGLPDFGKITVQYLPDRKIIELKSFKLYIHRYRNVGIFQENVVNKILSDLVKSCSPKFMVVVGEFKTRGGIRTKVSARFERLKS
ncbi:MAG: preQ(1) synthase [Candidatus Thermoplasmatota archaeon]|nr:preQ(1) synthase [Candidatus Thermoplasmatota archaeon]MCL5789657.1 preQ(1) synthase [Candidatus Thermoplasmatota archaeon]